MTALWLASDLHLGDGTKRDDFAPHAARFEESLLKIPRGTQIILAGDVADLWRYEFKAIVKHYAPALEMLADLKAIWLAGNHDRRILDAHYQNQLPGGFVFEKRLVIDGWYICHGDEFDLVNGRWFWIGKLLTQIISNIGLLLPKLEDTLAHIPAHVMRTGRHSRKYTFRKHALAFAENFLLGRSKCRGIVCGHTHRAANDRDYINTGYWTKDGWTVLKSGPPPIETLPPK